MGHVGRAKLSHPRSLDGVYGENAMRSPKCQKNQTRTIFVWLKTALLDSGFMIWEQSGSHWKAAETKTVLTCVVLSTHSFLQLTTARGDRRNSSTHRNRLDMGIEWWWWCYYYFYLFISLLIPESHRVKANICLVCPSFSSRAFLKTWPAMKDSLTPKPNTSKSSIILWIIWIKKKSL